MKTILVATDFSSSALNAAKYAADMALTINADMLLLHVCDMVINYAEMPLVMNVEDMVQYAEEDINEIKEQLIGETDGKLDIRVEVSTGFFFQELKAVCERVNPYAVVMGSQGKTAAERLLFGSQTIYAMKHLMWPLITVPPGAAFSSVKKIGLACDFDNVMGAMPIDEIKMLVNDFTAELHILNTGKKEVFDPEIVFGSGLLQEMLGALKPSYHFMTSDDTNEAIVDFADENHIDLLIVLPKRHDLLDKLIHRSHTKQLILHSHVPVMALHQ